MDREALARRYAQACATPSDIVAHLPYLVELVHFLRAQHVIELGSRTGVSTVAWLHALAGTGGRLTSVDLDPAPDIGTYPHWTHIRGDDCAPEVLARLDLADIVFIDTSHHFVHTCRELAIYRHLVRPGGALVLHDTELERPEDAPPLPPFPVARAIETFCRAERLTWHNRPGCWGLGVITL